MASLLASAPETFTGSNGATPNTANTVISTNQGSGGSWTIQSNQGRLRTGTASGNRSSFRVVSAARADAEIVFDWVIPTPNESFAAVHARHDTQAIDTHTSYYFTLERDVMEVGRMNASYTGTTITNINYTGRTAGTLMRTRIALFGTSIKVRTWPAANQENVGSWDATVTDSVVTGAGYWGITVSAASSGSKDLFIDNLDFLDTETPAQKKITPAGSLTASGVLVKRVPKTFVGSVTASGATLVRRVVVRLFTGSIGPSGALNGKQGVKNFLGSIAPSGAVAKQASKVHAGSITATGVVRRAWRKQFGGSIAPSSALLVDYVGRIFGRPGIVVMRLVRRATVTIRHRRV